MNATLDEFKVVFFLNNWIKKMKKEIFIVVTILFMSISSNLKAESTDTIIKVSKWNNSFGLYSGYNNNAFKSDSSLSTNINQFNLSLGYDFSDYFGLYTNANYISLLNFPERNFIAYEVGANYGTPINETETLIFTIDGSLLFREGFNDYSFFNSIYTGFNFGFNYTITDASSIKFESGLNLKDYNQLTSLSYLENKTAINYIISFESKTSITLGTGISTKLLTNPTSNSSIMAIINNKDTPELQTPKRKGKNSNSNNSSGNNSNQNQYDSTNSSNMNIGLGMGKIVSNGSFSLAIAQNIFEGTGISVKYSKSINLSDYNSQTINSYYDFVGDEDLYDDPYSSELQTLEMKLTQIMPYEIKSQIIGSVTNKNYKYSIINNLDQTLTRIDNNYNIELNFSKDFTFKDSFINYLKLNLSYQYFNNNSNDEFFNFQSNFIMMGTEISF